ncbi:MAG: nuclear transport factor 2 family protein [bacterium]
MVLVGGMVLTTVAAADDVADVKAATLDHIATLNAGDAGAHVQHHLAEHSSFLAAGGLLQESSSLEDQKNSLKALFDAGLKINWQVRHLKVKVYGNTAVTTCYLVGTITQPNGTTQQGTWRRSAVLIKQGGQWKEAHVHQSQLLPAPPQ